MLMKTCYELSEQEWDTYLSLSQSFETSVRWFGPSWGGPLCISRLHMDVPENMRCRECRHLISADSSGLVIPGLGADHRWSLFYAHLDCFACSLGLT